MSPPAGDEVGAALASDCKGVLVTAGFANVHLDVVNGVTYLTQLMTHEKVALPPGHWQLEGSSDGSDTVIMGMVGPDLDEEVVLDVDCQFKTQIWQTPQGVMLTKNGKRISLEHEEVSQKLGRAYIPVELGSSIGVEIAVFRRMRQWGGCVFWNIFDVHTVLELKSVPSTWTHKGLPMWETCMESLVGCKKHFVMSNHGGSKIDQLTWSQRCLPLTGVSTLGLLALLGRFCCSCRNHGGLQDLFVVLIVCCC